MRMNRKKIPVHFPQIFFSKDLVPKTCFPEEFHPKCFLPENDNIIVDKVSKYSMVRSSSL